MPIDLEPAIQARRNIRFVLCRPRIELNISASLDIIRDLGYESPCIVSRENPGPPIDTERYPTIREATAKQFLTVAITRRVGQKRKSKALSLESFCAVLPSWSSRISRSSRSDTAGIAVVFGNERSGLTDAEVESCNLAVLIPTSTECPSLNLSHAVAVVAYRVALALDESPAKQTDLGVAPDVEPVLSRDALERVALDLLDTIERGGYLQQDGPRGLKTYIRDLLSRCALTRSEAAYISDLIKRVVDE